MEKFRQMPLKFLRKPRYIQDYRQFRVSQEAVFLLGGSIAAIPVFSGSWQTGGISMRNPARSNLLVPEVREVMDIRQASDYLGISPDTLYKYASEGFVPAFKLGNRWRFKRSRLDEWMDRQSEQQAAEIDPEHKKPVRPAM
jgi:excisionase family DNA binding protein